MKADPTDFQRDGWTTTEMGLLLERGSFRFRVSPGILNTEEGGMVTDRRVVWRWQLWAAEGVDPENPRAHWGMFFDKSVSGHFFNSHDAACYAVESINFEGVSQ